MVEIINLNKARKARNRQAASALAAENRVKFGRTKAEKALDQLEAQRQARKLDGRLLDDLKQHADQPEQPED